jgi:GT2 family glycosyltransferase
VEAKNPRVLLAITVYNGRAFVPRCIDSAVHLGSQGFDLDVIVLDDKSPEPGWSDELAHYCQQVGVGYYCTPRNLGIPRNVSLGLLTALQGGYSHVVISNSDVIYAKNAVEQLLAICAADPSIGSATAWSNNVSLYSIPNEDPDRHLADQEVVDWVGASLAGSYGTEAIDIPAGISFAIMMPTSAVRDVGLMDPVFGRGYCEETDWSIRSRSLSYRLTLAPGAFVYHQGQGSNSEAGLVMSGHTTVPANEAIIDMRYPLFRSEVAAFTACGILQELHQKGPEELVRQAGRQFGYVIQVGWLPRVAAPDICRVMINPSSTSPAIVADFRGFRTVIPLGSEGDAATTIRSFFGRDPSGLDLLARGPFSQDIADAFGQAVDPVPMYPERV